MIWFQKAGNEVNFIYHAEIERSEAVSDSAT